MAGAKRPKLSKADEARSAGWVDRTRQEASLGKRLDWEGPGLMVE